MVVDCRVTVFLAKTVVGDCHVTVFLAMTVEVDCHVTAFLAMTVVVCLCERSEAIQGHRWWIATSLRSSQ